MIHANMEQDRIPLAQHTLLAVSAHTPDSLFPSMHAVDSVVCIALAVITLTGGSGRSIERTQGGKRPMPCFEVVRYDHKACIIVRQSARALQHLLFSPLVEDSVPTQGLWAPPDLRYHGRFSCRPSNGRVCTCTHFTRARRKDSRRSEHTIVQTRDNDCFTPVSNRRLADTYHLPRAVLVSYHMYCIVSCYIIVLYHVTTSGPFTTCKPTR